MDGFDLFASLGDTVLSDDNEDDISSTDLATTLRVLQFLGNTIQETGNKDILAKPRYRDLRIAIFPLCENLNKKVCGGKTAEEHDYEAERRKQQHFRQLQEKALDRYHIDKTNLRNVRLEKLNNLLQGSLDLPLIADGPSDDGFSVAELIRKRCNKQKLLLGSVDAVVKDGDEGKDDCVDAIDIDNIDNLDFCNDADGKIKGDNVNVDCNGDRYLNNPRSCYVCKKRFWKLHFHYDQLCPACAELNYRKRNQTCDLSGRVALLTGGRVKIGFHVGLKLVRCGANLIVTSRFPRNCVERYSACEDFSVWQHRIHVYGVDLRDLPAVECFAAFIKVEYGRLDIIVNNACQTVRRPPAYYRHLVAAETAPLDKILTPDIQLLLASQEKFHGMMLHMTQTPFLTSPLSASISQNHSGINDVVAANGTPSLSSSVLISALLSQIPCAPSDSYSSEAEFPEGLVDINNQQIDLRTKNSWNLKLEEVSTPEAVEVFSINALSPFILNGRLKPLMIATNAPNISDSSNSSIVWSKFIINVSAMEGKFYRAKTPNHPHTNMAKAALNMMTRTSSEDYSQSGIYMNAVDTGWINDENPLSSAKRIMEQHHFQTPIDEIDAAARILDPIFDSVLTGDCQYGWFYKDYRKSECVDGFCIPPSRSKDKGKKIVLFPVSSSTSQRVFVR